MSEPTPLVRWQVPGGYAGIPSATGVTVPMYRAEDVEAAVRHFFDQTRVAVQKVRRPGDVDDFVVALGKSMKALMETFDIAPAVVEDIEDHRTPESQRPDPTLPAWWISWYEADPEGTNDFTLHTPWWISGYRDRDDVQQAIYVGAVRARDEDHAFAIIEAAHDDPSVKVERRFCEPLKDPKDMPVNDLGKAQKPNSEKPWTYRSGRFPKADWMVWAW